MGTVKDLLEQQFDKLNNDVSEIINIDELIEEQSPQNPDYLELLQLFLFIFPDTNTLFNLTEVLNLKNVNIDDDKKLKLVSIIDKHLITLNKINKFIQSLD